MKTGHPVMVVVVVVVVMVTHEETIAAAVKELAEKMIFRFVFMIRNSK